MFCRSSWASSRRCGGLKGDLGRPEGISESVGSVKQLAGVDGGVRRVWKRSLRSRCDHDEVSGTVRGRRQGH